MNGDDKNQIQKEGRANDFLEMVMRYQDGTLSATEIQTLSEMMRNDPEKQKLFRRVQIRTAALHDVLRMDAFGRTSRLLDMESEGQGSSAVPSVIPSRRQQWRRSLSMIRWMSGLSLAVLLVSGAFVWNRSSTRQEVAQPEPIVPSVQERPVFLVEENRATFSGPAVLAAGSVVSPQQDYMLKSGMVKLEFPSGATTILEAPSIFRVESEDRLVLSIGGCSVHAPPGAEGFEVLTPLTKVVDRGTRFYVNVQDNSETEVHVIEGAADLYSINTSNDSTLSLEQDHSQSTESVRLKDGESARLGGFANSSGGKTRFDMESYRGQLPDRVVKYDASSTENGTADELTSLTVQRHGKIDTYPVEELIPIEVTSFQGDSVPERNGYYCGFREKPNRLEDLLEDRKLVTGLINFGGQPEPMNSQRLNALRSQGGRSAPPGLGIRFRSPVVNHPGPDVVLFEIQSFGNPVEGDPFHVYPVSDRSDLKPFTVRQFDLTLNSPTVRRVDPLWSHRSQQVASSLDELRKLDTPIVIDVGHSHFQVIAVGIDLSDLGYAEGESVEELFFQHAAEPGGHKVDPVMIVGLPPLRPEK